MIIQFLLLYIQVINCHNLYLNSMDSTLSLASDIPLSEMKLKDTGRIKQQWLDFSLYNKMAVPVLIFIYV